MKWMPRNLRVAEAQIHLSDQKLLHKPAYARLPEAYRCRYWMVTKSLCLTGLHQTSNFPASRGAILILDPILKHSLPPSPGPVQTLPLVSGRQFHVCRW